MKDCKKQLIICITSRKTTSYPPYVQNVIYQSNQGIKQYPYFVIIFLPIKHFPSFELLPTNYGNEIRDKTRDFALENGIVARYDIFLFPASFVLIRND